MPYTVRDKTDEFSPINFDSYDEAEYYGETVIGHGEYEIREALERCNLIGE